MDEQKYEIGEAFRNEWNRVRDKVDGNKPHDIDDTGNDDAAHNDIFLAKITGSVPGGGSSRYLAHLVYGTTNNNPSSLAAADLGKLATRNVEIWKPSEVDSNYVPVMLGGYNKVTGMPIYLALGSGSVPAGEFTGQILTTLDNAAVWLLDTYVPQLPG